MIRKIVIMYAVVTVVGLSLCSQQVSAGCAMAYIFGSYWYHYIAGIPDMEDRSTIRTLYYAYNQNTDTQTWAHNASHSSDEWFINDFGVWFAYGNWGNQQVSECPPEGVADHHIQMLAYDPQPGSDNDVKFAILGVTLAGGWFDFDNIADGFPWGGCTGCVVPLQTIPQPAITGVSLGTLGATWDVSLTWTEPNHRSYGYPTNHPHYLAGYHVYYAIVPEGTFPVDNDAAWTVADVAPFAASSNDNATINHTVGINATPTICEVMYFALRIVGQGTPVVSPFMTGFVGRNSINFWATDLMHLFPAPDGTFPTEPLRLTKLDESAATIEIDWDSVTCPSENYNIIYGYLANVSTYTEKGTLCWTNDPFTWNNDQTADLFFLVVGTIYDSPWFPSGDLYLESSWGKDSDGNERSGYTTDHTCGYDYYWWKESGHTCPIHECHSGEVFSVDAIVGTMQTVCGGIFSQGSATDEPCRNTSETQFNHTLTLNKAVMQTEVTRQMWADLRAVQPTLPADPSNTTYSPGMTNPAQNMTWFEAVLFANLLSLQNGFERCYYTDAAYTDPVTISNYTSANYCKFTASGYRLLSEGEWESAARAGMSSTFSCYESNYTSLTCGEPFCVAGEFPVLEQYAVFCANDTGKSEPVGSKLSNPWGFYDMHGNVWEWCWDWFDIYPSDTNDYTGAATGTERVRRGGYWSSVASGCRSAYRNGSIPGGRYFSIGFRLGRTTVNR